VYLILLLRRGDVPRFVTTNFARIWLRWHLGRVVRRFLDVVVRWVTANPVRLYILANFVHNTITSSTEVLMQPLFSTEKLPEKQVTRALHCGRFSFSKLLGMLSVSAVLGLAGCSDPSGPGTGQSSDGINADIGAAATSGVTYYVSATGSDANRGTSPSQAWRSIGKVNSKVFSPGDKILFQAGAVFSGRLFFDAADGGTVAGPITVSSYGTGRATISAGNGNGILLYNTAGFSITRLVLKGSGRTVNTESGVNVYTDLGGNVKLNYIRIHRVDASGFGDHGIVIGSSNNSTGYRDVRVTYSSVYDNGIAGISTYAQSAYSHQNFYFGHLKSYRNSGVPGLSFNSGNGIVMGGVTGGTIERSLAYDNGWLCDAAEGPVGIWAYNSDGIVIQHNESYRNRTNGTADGGGFDLDQNTRNSKLQYNYSHENDGPGFLLAHSPDSYSHSGNTIRYNISENDARKNSNGAIVVFGRTVGAEIYNNMVFVKPPVTGIARGIFIHNSGIIARDVENLHVRNNSFYTTGDLPVVQVTSDQLNGAIDLRFEGNNYFAGSYNPRIVWGGTTYTSLAAWRTGKGQERLNGADVGSQVNPGLTNPGSGGTIGNADLLHNLSAYRLISTSPLVDNGLDLTTTFGLNTGLIDFYSGSIPYPGKYDVGANEWR